MSSKDAGLHWLVGSAEDAGFEGARGLSLPATTPVTEAWAKVTRACGVTSDVLAERIAGVLSLPVAHLANAEQHVLRLLPEKVARLHLVLPLRETDRQIVIATADPSDFGMERDISFAAGRAPTFELAPPDRIRAALDERYSPGSLFESLLRDESDADVLDVVRVVQDVAPETLNASDLDTGPVIKLANIVLRDAVRQRVSDIHFEPGPGGGTVRFRVDGVMRTHMKMPMQALNRVVSRVKIMGKLDIADRLRPQDGRARIEVDGANLDLRISTVPTRESEKAVVRILRPDTSTRLADLSMQPQELQRFRALIGNRNGIVVVTGPTGSGKTTTLYSAIRELNNGENNIMTVEDPIEYEMAGITQMQVEAKRNVTFASSLRAILRQDPDIILVGEIRDLETAQIAVQASMTGHLVLATLHTNDAASAVTRFADIGLERATLATSLRGVVAQRLVRRVCATCAERVNGILNDAERELLKRYGVTPLVRAVGCPACEQSGYLGRFSVVEVLVMNQDLTAMVARGASITELQGAATASGMRSLLVSALARVAAGETTLEEVERVLGERGDETVAPRSEQSRVLVVDDDPVCRKVARKLLVEDGFEVVEAPDGETALERLQSGEDFTLAVLDLNLPGLGGRDVLSRVRGTHSTAALPVIVLTSSDDAEAEAELMEAGADDYIRKPIDPPRFLSRIHATLRRAAA